ETVSKDAGVTRSDKNGDMKTLRESKNGFTCMVAMGQPMCADANSMAFFGAWMKHENPSDKDGITYMLRGDTGARNTDPFTGKKTADNHWVATPPHHDCWTTREIYGLARFRRRRSNEAISHVGQHTVRACHDSGERSKVIVEGHNGNCPKQMMARACRM